MIDIIQMTGYFTDDQILEDLEVELRNNVIKCLIDIDDYTDGNEACPRKGKLSKLCTAMQ